MKSMTAAARRRRFPSAAFQTRRYLVKIYRIYLFFGLNN